MFYMSTEATAYLGQGYNGGLWHATLHEASVEGPSSLGPALCNRSLTVAVDFRFGKPVIAHSEGREGDDGSWTVVECQRCERKLKALGL